MDWQTLHPMSGQAFAGSCTDAMTWTIGSDDTERSWGPGALRMAGNDLSEETIGEVRWRWTCQALEQTGVWQSSDDGAKHQ